MCDISRFINEWSPFFTLLATFTLALLTYLSIKENRNIRLEDRQIEFQRKALDDVINWGSEIQQIWFSYLQEPSKYLLYLRFGLTKLFWQSKHIIIIAGIFGKELNEKVDKTATEIEKLHHILVKTLDNAENDDKYKLLQEQSLGLIQSVTDLFELVFKIKADKNL
jgi:hypothetical protein